METNRQVALEKPPCAISQDQSQLGHDHRRSTDHVEHASLHGVWVFAVLSWLAANHWGYCCWRSIPAASTHPIAVMATALWGSLTLWFLLQGVGLLYRKPWGRRMALWTAEISLLWLVPCFGMSLLAYPIMRDQAAILARYTSQHVAVSVRTVYVIWLAISTGYLADAVGTLMYFNRPSVIQQFEPGARGAENPLRNVGTRPAQAMRREPYTPSAQDNVGTRLMRRLVNTISAVPLRVRQYQSTHPRSPVLVASAVTALRLPTDAPVRGGLHWLWARRSVLLLTAQVLQCGSWTIPLETITQAVFLTYRSAYGKGMVLKVSTRHDVHYQFILYYDPAWAFQRVLPASWVDGRRTVPTYLHVLRRIVLFWIIATLALQIAFWLLRYLLKTLVPAA